jgi:hypothetical protein
LSNFQPWLWEPAYNAKKWRTYVMERCDYGRGWLRAGLSEEEIEVLWDDDVAELEMAHYNSSQLLADGYYYDSDGHCHVVDTYVHARHSDDWQLEILLAEELEPGQIWDEYIEAVALGMVIGGEDQMWEDVDVYMQELEAQFKQELDYESVFLEDIAQWFVFMNMVDPIQV